MGTKSEGVTGGDTDSKPGFKALCITQGPADPLSISSQNFSPATPHLPYPPPSLHPETAAVEGDFKETWATTPLLWAILHFWGHFFLLQIDWSSAWKEHW